MSTPIKTVYRIINTKGSTLARNGKFYGSFTPSKSGGTLEFPKQVQAETFLKTRKFPAGTKVQPVGLHAGAI